MNITTTFYIKNYENRNIVSNTDSRETPKYENNDDFYMYILYILYTIFYVAKLTLPNICRDLIECISIWKIKPMNDKIKDNNNLSAEEVIKNIQKKYRGRGVGTSSIVLDFNYTEKNISISGYKDILSFDNFIIYYNDKSKNIDRIIIAECERILNRNISKNTGQFFGYHLSRLVTGKRKNLADRYKLIGGTRRKKRKNIRTKRK
jgi:hypothetical protein